MDLNFLKTLTLGDNPPEIPSSAKLDKVPCNGADLRLFASGKIYPSVEFRDHYNLEYQRKDSTEVSNAIDIVEAKEWGVYPTDAPNIILVGFLPKNKPKTDLFGTCRYTPDGEPRSTVISSGAQSLELVDLAKKIYGEDSFSTGFIDLMIARDMSVTTNNGIYYVPKEITRGARKGETEVERREYNGGLFPLVPFEAKDTEVESEEESSLAEHYDLSSTL